MYKTVEVDVDLEDFDTDDLIEELDRRGELPEEFNLDIKELVEKIYLKRIFGLDYHKEVDSLIYEVLGRIV